MENKENKKNNVNEEHKNSSEPLVNEQTNEEASEDDRDIKVDPQDRQNELAEENVRLNDLLLRSKADFENLQKRTLKQIQQAQLFSTEKLSSELLIIMDSLETVNNLSKDSNLKIDNLIEGNSLLLKTTTEVFEKLGIEEINPLNKDFDPELHQAMATKEDEKSSENTVLEVMQKGYKLKSKLLRPALVIVSKKNK
jgi:molecular chaperone GrpE